MMYDIKSLPARISGMITVHITTQVYRLILLQGLPQN